MPDHYKDLRQYILTSAFHLYHQFQRFLTNITDFHQSIDKSNKTPSPDEIVTQVKYNNLILNDLHIVVKELCTIHHELNKINERIKILIPPTHPLHPAHPSKNQDLENYNFPVHKQKP